jgi:hypothetical protein
MTRPEPCPHRHEDMVALVMGELDPSAVRELQEHIAACDACRATYKSLAEEEEAIRSGFEALARSLATVEQAVLQQRRHPSRVRINVSNHHFLERTKKMILAHKRLSATAAATVAGLAASLMFYVLLFSSSTVAYALEQTARANDRVTSYHVKVTPPEELGEAWVEMKPDGSPLRARLDLVSPNDGPKVSILYDDRAEVWFKKENSFVTIRDKNALEEFTKMRALFDPKLAFKELQDAEKAGKVRVETKEPSKEGQPITLTVTSKAAPDRREVYEVDPETKLVRRVTDYRREDGQWKQVSQREYLDYNQPIHPSIFQPRLPENIVKVDQFHHEVGLAKGNLTDDEIATKVVREFFEALIAKDYKKAAMIYEGMPEARMKDAFGRFDFLRIVELGKPTPAEDPRMKALRVPTKVEWQVKDQKVEKSFTLTVATADAEAATKAAREFCEAVIAEDYPKANRIAQETGLVLQDASAEAMKNVKQFFRPNVAVVRIIEIGTPTPQVEGGTTTSKLTIKVEVQITSLPKEVREFSPFVRPVHGQPDRWGISGGI